jgi:hypothetical protein
MQRYLRMLFESGVYRHDLPLLNSLQRGLESAIIGDWASLFSQLMTFLTTICSQVRASGFQGQTRAADGVCLFARLCPVHYDNVSHTVFN